MQAKARESPEGQPRVKAQGRLTLPIQQFVALGLHVTRGRRDEHPNGMDLAAAERVRPKGKEL